MKEKLKELWSKIDAWDAVQPDGTSFNEPLSMEEILQFQERIGLKLPQDFVDSLQVHNGSHDYLEFCHGYFYSISEIEDAMKFQQNLVVEIFGKSEIYKENIKIIGPIRRTYWSPAWVPFHSTDWCETCIDLDPAEGGVIGQIIEVSRETRDITLMSENYIEFLKNNGSLGTRVAEKRSIQTKG